MGIYNSENTTVLATREVDGKTKALMLHRCSNGEMQYVIGSHFHQQHYDGALGYERWDYEWSWGHYFHDVVDAVDHWKLEAEADPEQKVEVPCALGTLKAGYFGKPGICDGIYVDLVRHDGKTTQCCIAEFDRTSDDELHVLCWNGEDDAAAWKHVIDKDGSYWY